MRALALLLVLAAGALADEYQPAPYVLYGHGEGGDGLGYGIRSSRVTDRGPWGFYDNSVPGYRYHGMWLSHAFYGRTRNDPEAYYVGSAPRRGVHEATLSYDRSGRPVYTPD